MHEITVTTHDYYTKKYNTIVVYFDENSKTNLHESDIAEALRCGTIKRKNTRAMTQISPVDGKRHGEFFTNISEEHQSFKNLNNLIDRAGAYLEEVD